MIDTAAVAKPRHDLLVAGVAVVAVAIGAASIARVVLATCGFPLDDAWIHQVVGRNAALTGVPGFTPGVRSSGSTSALWPWVIAVKYRLLPAVDPVHFMLAVNLAGYVAVIGLLLVAARRDRLPTADAIALVALPAVTGNLVWLVSSGMEHMAFIAASFLAAVAWTSPAAGGGRALAAGTGGAVAILLRPEAVIFVAMLAGHGILTRRPWRDLVRLLVPCAVALGLFALWNIWTSHSALPVTFSGRKWLYFGDALSDGPSLRLAIKLLVDWWRQIVRFFLGVEAGPRTTLLLSVLCGLVMVAGVVRLAMAGARTTLLLLAMTFADAVLYAVMLPNPGHGMRYQAMLLVFVFPLLALGVMEVVGRAISACGFTGRRDRIDAVVVSLAGVVALHSLVDWMRITDEGIRHIEGTHKRMAQWIAETLPPGTPVASFDIGVLGYFGNVAVTDLGGLVDPAFVPHLFARTSARVLKERGIGWLVLPDDEPPGPGPDPSCTGFSVRLRLCGSADMIRTEVVAFHTAPADFDRSFAATTHAGRGQVLYRLTWP